MVLKNVSDCFSAVVTISYIEKLLCNPAAECLKKRYGNSTGCPLSCITNMAIFSYGIQFLHRTKEQLFSFSLILFLNRNDEKWKIEITFFHRWELHGKRNINNSQEGIKIEWLNYLK